MDIDQRMEALLKDHQEMGARPAQEPNNGDAYPATLPLREAGTSGGKTVIDKTAKQETTAKQTRTTSKKK
jgi:hypothetical protein